jgi:hypothetical protein
MDWAEEEFETLELGDARLNRRAVLLAERLSQKPGSSIPGACKNWSETVAAYRLPGQRRDRLGRCDGCPLGCHEEANRPAQRGAGQPGHHRAGLQRPANARAGAAELRSTARHAAASHLCHDTPARTPGHHERLDVGQGVQGGDAPRGGLLESRRWIERYDIIAEQAGQLPETRHVFVGDRESDILALMVRARDLLHAADYLVRCQHNRARPQGNKLWERVMKSEPVGARPERSGKRSAYSA